MKMNRRVAALAGVVGLALTGVVGVLPEAASAATTTVHLWLSAPTGTLDTAAPLVYTDGECPLVNGNAAATVRVAVKGGTGQGAITSVNGINYIGANQPSNIPVSTTGNITGYIFTPGVGSWNDWAIHVATLPGQMLGTYNISAICLYSGATRTFDSTFTVDASGNYTSLAVGTQPPAVQNTVKPTITGTPLVGGTLTATNGTWDQAGSTFAYQWNLDGTPIASATANTYSPVAGDLGKAITVTVTATKANFNDGVATSDPVTVVDQLPTILNTAKPTIAGSGYVGTLLVANPGTWDTAGATFAYQWNLDGNAIMGANTNQYIPVSGDAGHNVTVTVTASKSGSLDGVATSDPLSVVALKTFKATKAPTVVGNATVGSTLTAGNPTWSISGVSVSFQWLRGGAAITNAKSKTYKLTASDKGKSIAVRVTGSASGYNNATTTSTAIIWNNALPKVTGKAKVGQTLKSSTGTWSTSGTKATYQWTRNGSTIKGATKSSYKLTKTDKGKKVGVKVTVTKSGYRTASASSAAVKVS